MKARFAALALVAVLGLSGCAAYDPGGPPRDVAGPTITPPPTHGGFDYQLGGGYTPPAGVTYVTRDSTDVPDKGVYTSCYVNGFQTQPGVAWPSGLILHTPSGAPLVDPGWPDEHLIDISTAAKREQAAARIGSTISECAKKGFKAVDFDNLDSYSRSKGALTLTDAIAFAKLLVGRAHAAGLAAGQKNTTELGSRGKTQIGFDFVTAEECDRFSECSVYTKAFGAHVYDIEYTDDLRGTFAAVCARSTTPSMTILRDRDLVTPSDKAYVYKAC